MTISRAEHIAWCKARALEYLPHEPLQALTSFVSDFAKEITPSKADEALLLTMIPLHLSRPSPESVRTWIEGWN